MAVPTYLDWKIEGKASFWDGYWGVREIKNSIVDKFKMLIRYLSAEVE